MVTTQVMTMANCIVGVSVLAMPFCFKQCGVVLASILLMLSGVMTRTVCYFLLKASTITRRRTYELLAYHTFGQAGKLVVEISIIGFLIGTLIAFLVVMGDLGPEIMSDVFSIENNSSLRTIIMTALSLFVALPLGLLRNIDSLAGVSTVTMLFYLILVGKIFSEGMGPLWSGSFLTRIHYWRPAGVLQCIPIFSMALSCQTQIFGIYDSLPEPSLQKMNEVVKKAINMCTAFYICVGFLGYIAFCTQNFSGNILLSFKPTGSTQLIKLCFIMSIAFSFPLVIFPCRASLHSLIFKRVQLHHHVHDITTNYIPESRLKLLTLAIVAFTLFIGLMIPNIELVLGLVGSTTGSVICIIFPAVMFIRVTSKHTTERILAQTVFFVGVIIMVVTTYVTLYAVEQAQVNMPDIDHVTEIRKVIVDDPMLGKHELPKSIDTIVRDNPPDIQILKKDIDKVEIMRPAEKSLPGEVIFRKNVSAFKIPDETKAKLHNLDKAKESPPPSPLSEVVKPSSKEQLGAKVVKDGEDKVVQKVKESPVKGVSSVRSVNKPVHNVPDVPAVESPVVHDAKQNVENNIPNRIDKLDSANNKNEGESKPAVSGMNKNINQSSHVSPDVPSNVGPEKLNQEDFLLQQLKEHEKEQKKLLEEQKEILAKLKQHQADDELKESLKEEKADRKIQQDLRVSNDNKVGANENFNAPSENLRPNNIEQVEPRVESKIHHEPVMNGEHERSQNADRGQPDKPLQEAKPNINQGARQEQPDVPHEQMPQAEKIRESQKNIAEPKELNTDNNKRSEVVKDVAPEKKASPSPKIEEPAPLVKADRDI